MSEWFKNEREGGWIRIEPMSPDYANAASDSDTTEAATTFEGDPCKWCELTLPHTIKLHESLV